MKCSHKRTSSFQVYSETDETRPTWLSPLPSLAFGLRGEETRRTQCCMLATTPRLYASTHEACASSTGQRIVVAASSAAVISARLAGHPAWHKDAASHSPATLGRAGDIRFPMMHASMWFSQDGIPADQTILTLRVWMRPCDLSICTISRQVHARAHSHAPAHHDTTHR